MHAKLAVGHVQVASSPDAAAEEKGAGCPLMKTRERERGRENPSVAAPEGVVGPSLTSCSLSYKLDFVRWLRATESQGDAHAPPLTMSLCKTWLAKITRKSAQ